MVSRAHIGLAVAAACLAAPGGAAAAGGLDLTFGTGGKATVPELVLGGQRPSAELPQLQPDGRYLVSGTHNERFFIARLTAAFAPDPAFSGDGMATTDASSGPDLGAGLAVQADGKIVQVGEAAAKFGVVRYLADGSLDTSFDQDGIALVDFGPVHATGSAVAIQPDGRIVVIGNIAGRLAIARLNADGSLDTGFSGDGIDRQPDFPVGGKLALQPNGAILVLGTTEFSALRYRSDGTLDPAFGGDGLVQEDLTADGTVNQSCGLALQPDGRIVLSGFAGPNFAIARLRSDGSLDPDFSGDGKLTTDLGDIEGGACTVAVQPDGRILQAGETNFHSGEPTRHDSDFALVRYSASGGRDSTFGTAGVVTTDFGESESCCALAFRRSDGRLVAAGFSTDIGTATKRTVVARYHAFDCRGKTVTQVGTSGADTLEGRLKGTTPLADVIEGFAGADLIDGEGAGDNLCGGDGADDLRGGPGADAISGGLGTDTASGGADADSIDLRDGQTDGSVSCGTGLDALVADLQDPVAGLIFSQCESVKRFALDDGPPGFPGRKKLRIGPDGRVSVRVKCPRRARLRCRGKLTLTHPRRPGAPLAKARYRVPLGARRAVILELPPAAAARLRARGRVRARTLEQGVSEKGRRSAFQLIRIA